MENFILEKIKNLSDMEVNILDAASDEFEKTGFYETNVDNIAKNVGIGKGTIYRHFGSKMGLFFHAIGLTFYKKLEVLLKAGDIEDPYEALDCYISNLIIASNNFMTRKNIMMEIFQIKNGICNSEFFECISDMRKIYVNDILVKIISKIYSKEGKEPYNNMLISECISFFIGSYWHAKFTMDFFGNKETGNIVEDDIKQIKAFIFKGIGIPEEKFKNFI